MASIHHFENFSVVANGVNIEVDLSRLEGNFNRAQYKLDSAIMTSMEKYMPKRSGQFVNTTKAMSAAVAGTGTVVAAASPMGRFLYEGNAMIGERSRSAWAKKGEKKILSGGRLNYTSGGPHWFDRAKESDMDNWESIVRNEIGGG